MQQLPPRGRHWRFSQDKFSSALEDNRIIFGKNGDSKPQFKRFLSEAMAKGENISTIWDDVGTTTEGTKEVMQLFEGQKIFDFPKPVFLIKRILQISTAPNDLILDFFAGSGKPGRR